MLDWFMANGRNHLLKADQPLTGQCGIQPMIAKESRPPVVTYDPASEIPPSPCRSCLMVAALEHEAIDEEPMGFARSRGVMPVDEPDIVKLGLSPDSA